MQGIEPTNKMAERALRPAVIYRKLSFGTQSEAGSRFIKRMLTISETCRLQKRPLYQWLCDAVSNGLFDERIIARQESRRDSPTAGAMKERQGNTDFYETHDRWECRLRRFSTGAVLKVAESFVAELSTELDAFGS